MSQLFEMVIVSHISLLEFFIIAVFDLELLFRLLSFIF